MAFRMKIKANNLLQNRYMYIDDHGVEFCETALISGKQHFSYSEVDYIFISKTDELTFQVRDEVFTLPIKPRNQQHQAFIAAFVRNVKATLPSPE